MAISNCLPADRRACNPHERAVRHGRELSANYKLDRWQ